MKFKKEFLSKISDNENTTMEDYLPIMKMILSEEEFYIVCKMNNIRIEENDEFSHHIKELESFTDRNKYFKLKQLSIIENRAIKKLKIAYEINNSYLVTKEDLINYYNAEISKIERDLNDVLNIKRGDEKDMVLYQFPYSIIKFSHTYDIITYDKKEYFLKQLYFCKSYYENKINSLNNKKKVLANK